MILPFTKIPNNNFDKYIGGQEDNENNRNNEEENNEEENNENQNNENQNNDENNEDQNNENNNENQNNEENNDNNSNENQNNNEDNEEENNNEDEDKYELLSYIQNTKLGDNVINHIAEDINLSITDEISGDSNAIILTNKNNLEYKKIIKRFRYIKIAVVSVIKVKNKKKCKKYKIYNHHNVFYYNLYVSDDKLAKCKENYKTIEHIKNLLESDEEEEPEQNEESEQNEKPEQNEKEEEQNEKPKQNEKNEEPIEKVNNQGAQKKFNLDTSIIESETFKIEKKSNINRLVSDIISKFNKDYFQKDFEKMPFMIDYINKLIKVNDRVIYYNDEQIFININEDNKVNNTLRELFEDLFKTYLKDKSLDKKERFKIMKNFIDDCIVDDKCKDIDTTMLKDKLKLLSNNSNNLNIVYSIFYDGSDLDHILYNKINNIVLIPIYYYNEEDEFSVSYLIYKNLKIYRFKPSRKYFNEDKIEKEIDDYLNKSVENSYINDKYNVIYKGLINIDCPMDKYKTIESTLWNLYLIFLIIINPDINIDNLSKLLNIIMKQENKSETELMNQFSNYLQTI